MGLIFHSQWLFTIKETHSVTCQGFIWDSFIIQTLPNKSQTFYYEFPSLQRSHFDIKEHINKCCQWIFFFMAKTKQLTNK